MTAEMGPRLPTTIVTQPLVPYLQYFHIPLGGHDTNCGNHMTTALKGKGYTKTLLLYADVSIVNIEM